ncbi:hypothetical protein [Geoglobus ahangari]
MQLSELERIVEDALVEWLAHIYRAVDWKKTARNHSAYDIFEHRLEFSRYEPDIPSIHQKLCNTLSLQAPYVPLDVMEFLRKHESIALRILRKMPKLLTLKAAQRAKELKSGSEPRSFSTASMEEIEKLVGGEGG